MKETTDIDILLKRIQKGDRQAFNLLCQDRYASLLSYARLFLSDEWAEDVVQDVFFSLWKNRSTIRRGTSLQGYLMQAVFNRSVNYLKKGQLAKDFREWNQSRIDMMTLFESNPDNNPTIRRLYDGDLRIRINEAIESLSPRTREVFRLSYIEDMSNKDISQKLSLSLSTVENHIYMALKQLRTQLTSLRQI